MINFKGQYIQPITIQRKGIDNNFHDYKVSLAELKTSSQNDLIAINNLNCAWNNCQTLVNDTAKIFNSLYAKTKSSEDEHFYVITTQKENYDKLNQDNILGILQTKNKNGKIEIENLQVSPSTNYFAIVRNFKQVGRSLVTAVINLNRDKSIELLSEFSALPFYEKMGFVRTGNKTTRMVLKK